MGFGKQKVFGVVLIIIGIVFILNSFWGISGFVIFEGLEDFLGDKIGFAIGMVLVAGGIFTLVLSKERLENMIIASRVKEDSFLSRIAKGVGKKEPINRDINHLISELNRGNTNPGVGTKSISPGIYELRGRNGGRVYYKDSSGGRYEVLGYSDKETQDKVIKHIRKKYS